MALAGARRRSFGGAPFAYNDSQHACIPPGERLMAGPDKPDDRDAREVDDFFELPEPERPRWEHRPRVDSDGLIISAGPTFKNDFVRDVPDDEDVDIELRPPEGLSPAQRRAIATPPIPLTVEEEEEPPLWQFSMVELMVLMTFFSAGFAVMYYLPPAQVAGVLGLLALVGQGLMMRFPPETRHVRLAAMTLLVMYGLAASVAFVQHLCGWS